MDAAKDTTEQHRLGSLKIVVEHIAGPDYRRAWNAKLFSGKNLLWETNVVGDDKENISVLAPAFFRALFFQLSEECGKAQVEHVVENIAHA